MFFPTPPFVPIWVVLPYGEAFGAPRLVLISVGRSCSPLDRTSNKSFALAGLSLVSASASNFVPGHQWTASSSPSSNASRIAARSTLLSRSSGSLIDVDRAWRDVESTVSSVGAAQDAPFIRALRYRPNEAASAAESISAVPLLLAMRRRSLAVQYIG